ncbi:hypothetical protein RhiirA5_410073 [Rhizophagus irregularis]|uniref:Uncharacterized protein n=1 Tax=Rhizophagus irregularis TaxID=588596 RepID=A0A2I1F5J7_9GLOM|nr:hypothetical protein RhiirA5_410073 [Rhizophagus irregularis]PKY29652.1 hypothetical protein RhiirB3_446348 [Rhizophagus irregularis]CAB4464765.1 unnamed protein product [Rhizophagus irregularis]CAB5206067.1 unnamed protein product [Rhizophagus irregularis]CAB5379334.1 unnamed protein product [Rhizophagus irregularis]
MRLVPDTSQHLAFNKFLKQFTIINLVLFYLWQSNKLKPKIGKEEFWSIQTKAEHKNECRDFWNSIFKSLEQVELSSDCSNKNFVINLFPGREISVVCCIDEAHTLLAEHTDNETYFVHWS